MTSWWDKTSTLSVAYTVDRVGDSNKPLVVVVVAAALAVVVVRWRCVAFDLEP